MLELTNGQRARGKQGGREYMRRYEKRFEDHAPAAGTVQAEWQQISKSIRGLGMKGRTRDE